MTQLTLTRKWLAFMTWTNLKCLEYQESKLGISEMFRSLSSTYNWLKFSNDSEWLISSYVLDLSDESAGKACLLLTWLQASHSHNINITMTWYFAKKVQIKLKKIYTPDARHILVQYSGEFNVDLCLASPKSLSVGSSL